LTFSVVSQCAAGVERSHLDFRNVQFLNFDWLDLDGSVDDRVWIGQRINPQPRSRAGLVITNASLQRVRGAANRCAAL
jgi:hypothetical protein